MVLKPAPSYLPLASSPNSHPRNLFAVPEMEAQIAAPLPLLVPYPIWNTDPPPYPTRLISVLLLLQSPRKASPPPGFLP